MKSHHLTLLIIVTIAIYSCDNGEANKEEIIPITPSEGYNDHIYEYSITRFDNYTIDYREDGLINKIKEFAGEETAYCLYSPLHVKSYYRSIMDKNQLDSTMIDNLKWLSYNLLSECDITNGYYYYEDNERIEGGFRIKATFSYNIDEQLTDVTFIGSEWRKSNGSLMYEDPISETIINTWNDGNLLKTTFSRGIDKEILYTYSNKENKNNIIGIPDIEPFYHTTPSTIGIHALIFGKYLGQGSRNLATELIKIDTKNNEIENKYNYEYIFLDNGLIDYIIETDSLHNDIYKYHYSYIIQE